MTNRILRDILQYGLTHLNTHPEFRHYIHFSFIVVDNQIVTVGKNRAVEPPPYYGYHKRVEKPKIHSELDAYSKYKWKTVGFEMVNLRLSRQGEMKLSKPCPICAEWLSQTMCTGLVYSTKEGWEWIR